MAPKTKNHINILNLLEKYENRFQANNKTDWRLKQYIKALLQMLQDEENRVGKLNDELIASKKKVEFFKGLLDAQSNEILLDKYSAINLLSSRSIDPIHSSSKTKNIHLNQIAKCEKEIKQELFQRNTDDAKHVKLHSEKNFDDIVKYHKLLQDQVTNEMVELAQNLKHNLTVSNEIVKKDTELLDRTNTFADTTYSNLKVNSDRVKEFANMACEYWLWISLFIVTFTFLSMVIFIRLFPKKNIVYIMTSDNKVEL